jgi:hypothetical protein
MGFVSNPPNVTFQAVNSLAQVNAFAIADSGAANPGHGIGEFGIGTNPGLGTNFATLSQATPIVGKINRQENTNQNNGGFFGWGGSGGPALFHPFLVGANPNEGGFYLELYAGIGDNLNLASKPAYFIGLSSQGAVVNPRISTNMTDAIGMIIDSTAASVNFPWQSIIQRGAGAAVLAGLGGGVLAATGQLFALRFSCPPNSDHISMTIKQLTALGQWTTLFGPTDLTGTGPAQGTRLLPQIYGVNNVGVAGTGSGIIFHRLLGTVDVSSVGSAF